MADNTNEILCFYIRQIADGNIGALEGVGEQVGALMYSVALSVLRNKADAEDAVHDTYLKIVNKALFFRYGKSAKAWICKIVYNISLDILRKNKRTINITAFDEIECADTDDALPLALEMLDCLNVRERFLLEMKYWLDLSALQIAKELRVSKSTVAKRISEAENKIKKIYNIFENKLDEMAFSNVI